MAVDIQQQSSSKPTQSKSGGRKTANNTGEYQRRWMQTQKKHQEQQNRLVQQNIIKNAKDRESQQIQTTATKRKKKFIDGIGKFLIPSVATGGGIIGMLFGIN